MSEQPRIAIAWNGLPFYAARLIRAGIEQLGKPVTVIGSQPAVPITGMEAALGQKIYWLNTAKSCSWSDLQVPVPEIFFQTGWAYPGFNSLGREVRQHGGKVVSMVDNCWKNNSRQWLGAVIFRLNYQPWFDAVWVPGRSGFQLCRFFGMSENRIYQGMYGADPDVFTSGSPLSERNKQFLFVGQLIERKGVKLLVEAFQRFREQFPDWTLKVIGSGPLASFLDCPGITVQGFQQPPVVAQIMRQSRFLILPSYEEHWGLVVHEAALSGCGLIVSYDELGAVKFR